MRDSNTKGTKVKALQFRLVGAVCVLAALSLLVAACGGGSDSTSESTETTGVSLQLDWTPNTNHTGFYVADEKGYYEEAGIKLNILPYNEVATDTVVGAGKANCGITNQENLPIAVAAGTNEVSVMPITQRTVQVLIVKKDSKFKSPKDLDGGTYGGFGYPYEVPIVSSMMKYDGGTGEIKDVILNTGAYEAVYGGQVDSSLGYRTWNLIEARERNIELREFPQQEYGIPETYNVLMSCNGDWLMKNPELAKAFVQATAKGFEFAIEDPKAAAKILIDANPSVFPSESLVYASAEMLAKEYYADEEGNFGCQTSQRWAAFSEWLYEQGVINGSDGKPLSSPPDYEAMWSGDYAPRACAGS